MKLSELTENKPNFTEIDKINFEKEYDVIVCGMGTAGSLAALLMAQNGLSVLGVDILSCVGGNHTAGASRPVMYDKGVDSRVASSVEHKADINIETIIIIYINDSSISFIYEVLRSRSRWPSHIRQA